MFLDVIQHAGHVLDQIKLTVLGVLVIVCWKMAYVGSLVKTVCQLLQSCFV